MVHASPAPEDRYSEFFLISEDLEAPPINPVQMVAAQWNKIPNKIDLLNWVHHQKSLPVPKEKYDRLKHFGTWINDKRDRSCLNTRGKVLTRDSLKSVKLDYKGCKVESGKWYDPSVDQTYTDAEDVEIDHFVPVKNAYIGGAWKWSKEVRCMYFNFLGNDLHLTPLNKPQNRSKADNTPERYMPPEKSYRCEYLAKWLTVKAIWNVAINPKEGAAILSYIRSENCNPQDFKLTADYVQDQRQWIQDNLAMCQ